MGSKHTKGMPTIGFILRVNMSPFLFEFNKTSFVSLIDIMLPSSSERAISCSNYKLRYTYQVMLQTLEISNSFHREISICYFSICSYFKLLIGSKLYNTNIFQRTKISQILLPPSYVMRASTLIIPVVVVLLVTWYHQSIRYIYVPKTFWALGHYFGRNYAMKS